MDNYLSDVNLSKLPKEVVQDLLKRFFLNTQPRKLKFNPTVIKYSDTRISFGMRKHYGVLSLSAELLLKNISTGLAKQGVEMMNETKRGKTLVMTSGNMTYFDNDILDVDFYSLIVRVDSVNALIKGGLPEYLQNKNVYGTTNGRLLICSDMGSCPSPIDELYTDVLLPNHFKEKEDFVCGYCGLYEKKDYGKPVEWCLVPWLESEISTAGCFVKFKEPYQ